MGIGGGTPRGDALEFTVSTVWREERVSCPHPDILTAYQSGALEEAAGEFVRFHLEESACPFCNAICEDLDMTEEDAASAGLPGMRDRLMRSTVAALRSTRR